MPASIRRWESALVARIAAGDNSALATIYDQFGALVYGIACRTVGPAAAIDVTEDVFAALWDHPDQFIGEHRSLRTGLATLARSCARDVLLGSRASAGHVAVEGGIWSDAPLAAPPNIDEAASALFAAERLRTAFELLPDHERQALELAYVDRLTFREVAVRTGTSESTATWRVRQALERLARQLHDRGPVGLA